MEEKQRTGRVVWIGQVRVDGKQRQKTLGPKSGKDALTKRQAEAALRVFRDDAEAKAASDAQTPVRTTTLRSVATEHLRHLESNDTKASTVAGYRGYLEGHLMPFFSDVPPTDIRVSDVERFIAYQRTEAKQRRLGKDGKPKIGLAGSTVSNHVNYLHAIFAFRAATRARRGQPGHGSREAEGSQDVFRLLVPHPRPSQRGHRRRARRPPALDGPDDHPDRRDVRTAPKAS